MRLSPLRPEEATGKAKEALTDIYERHGSAGPMVRAMAKSPALLRGYLDLSAVIVLREPAAIDDVDLDRLRDFGYSDRQIADTVALVALNQLTGSFNLVAGLEPARAPTGV
jgi:alkylhydroperoxidase family enzyme